MTDRAGLTVDPQLVEFIESEVLPGLALKPEQFWGGLALLATEFSTRNRTLLARRDDLQRALDAWYRANVDRDIDPGAHEQFLRQIGYVVPEPPAFAVDTGSVDDELCRIAGPQLVVPVSNARYALNAANARWGSLYDALYGTDALAAGVAPPHGAYDAVRGERVVARAKMLLDLAAPLQNVSHTQVRRYEIESGRLLAHTSSTRAGLVRAEQFVGFEGSPSAPSKILLRHHGLHIELRIDASSAIGAKDSAGVADVLLEAAISTIVDCEDSVSAVDAQDKVNVYRNWLGLMQGTLTETFTKDGQRVVRSLHADRSYLAPDGKRFEIPGRALLLLRHVGLHMFTDAVRDLHGAELPEGLLDAMVTTTIALHDLQGTGTLRNSRSGSIYVVKPKLHGPDEVAFTVDVFARLEQLLKLPPNTLKIGVMDEERRTSVNLAACIHAARHRLVFINTGFLDRTGDEIHSAMAAGLVVRKADMRHCEWIKAYEERNVAIGLTCGLQGRAQIGKGMWAAPDRMADMLAQKIAHPRAGATTAWVPSPTAATLHALHYHEVDVMQVQRQLTGKPAPGLSGLLRLPLAPRRSITAAQAQAELDENAQSLLGYVVRWIDQGVGCSKVPDIHNVGLMEDRATLRISSQLLANWLFHGLIGKEQFETTLRRMAAIVDQQNAADAHYRPMAPRFDGPAFAAARELVLSGAHQANGYTEPVLHKWRRVVKATQP